MEAPTLGEFERRGKKGVVTDRRFEGSRLGCLHWGLLSCFYRGAFEAVTLYKTLVDHTAFDFGFRNIEYSVYSPSSIVSSPSTSKPPFLYRLNPAVVLSR